MDRGWLKKLPDELIYRLIVDNHIEKLIVLVLIVFAGIFLFSMRRNEKNEVSYTFGVENATIQVNVEFDEVILSQRKGEIKANLLEALVLTVIEKKPESVIDCCTDEECKKSWEENFKKIAEKKIGNVLSFKAFSIRESSSNS